MAARDPEVRRLAAVKASNTRWAFPERAARRGKAPVPPESVLTSYEERVDPSGKLAPLQRRKQAAALWRADQAERAREIRKAALTNGGDDGGAAA